MCLQDLLPLILNNHLGHYMAFFLLMWNYVCGTHYLLMPWQYKSQIKCKYILKNKCYIDAELNGKATPNKEVLRYSNVPTFPFISTLFSFLSDLYYRNLAVVIFTFFHRSQNLQLIGKLVFKLIFNLEQLVIFVHFYFDTKEPQIKHLIRLKYKKLHISENIPHVPFR